MLILTIISFLLLAGFIVLSCALFYGIPGSYSAFSAEWRTMCPKLNVWSVVTALAAFGMVPPMIGAGEGFSLQCLGFFAPLYLVIVALTPEWDIKPKQHVVHTVGAIICAVLAFAWLLFIRGHWWVAVICLAAGIAAGVLTRTLRASLVFWGEAVMFSSVYLSLWIGG
jgi:hypothetical protein